MGYRSEVRAIVYGPDDKLTAFIAAWQLQHGNQLFEHFGDALKRYRMVTKHWTPPAPNPDDPEGKVPFDTCWTTEEVSCFDLYGENWKWYESYDDVQLWHQFMDEAAVADLSWEFLRIGENARDIERRVSDPGKDLDLLGFSSPRIIDEIDKIENSEQPIKAL